MFKLWQGRLLPCVCPWKKSTVNVDFRNDYVKKKVLWNKVWSCVSWGWLIFRVVCTCLLWDSNYIYIYIMTFYEFQVPGQWNWKQTASWCTANMPFLPSMKQKGEMTRELSGWVITGEKAKFAWFVAWELAWAEAAEIYLKRNEILYLRVCQESKWSNIFLMEHLSTGKVLCFENITSYGNILLSAILLMQHGALSMTDLASFLSQQLPRRLVLLFDFGGFQGSTTSGLTDLITLIPVQHF